MQVVKKIICTFFVAILVFQYVYQIKVIAEEIVTEPIKFGSVQVLSADLEKSNNRSTHNKGLENTTLKKNDDYTSIENKKEYKKNNTDTSEFNLLKNNEKGYEHNNKESPFISDKNINKDETIIEKNSKHKQNQNINKKEVNEVVSKSRTDFIDRSETDIGGKKYLNNDREYINNDNIYKDKIENILSNNNPLIDVEEKKDKLNEASPIKEYGNLTIKLLYRDGFENEENVESSISDISQNNNAKNEIKISGNIRDKDNQISLDTVKYDNKINSDIVGDKNLLYDYINLENNEIEKKFTNKNEIKFDEIIVTLYQKGSITPVAFKNLYKDGSANFDYLKPGKYRIDFSKIPKEYKISKIKKDIEILKGKNSTYTFIITGSEKINREIDQSGIGELSGEFIFGSDFLYKSKTRFARFLRYNSNLVDYISTDEGIYPYSFIQDGKNIRNANTVDMNSKGENYKIEYNDCIIGKSAHETSEKDKFKIKLTIEGKTKFKKGKLDVMFVLDNSNSMNKNFDGETTNYRNTKIKALNDAVRRMTYNILKNSGNRVGIVNFSTLTYRLSVKPTVDSNLGIGNIKYQKYDYIGLTDNNQMINNAIPVIGRLSITYTDGDIDENMNAGIKYDGLTNIIVGYKKGVELLYQNKDDNDRKKLMILFTDGIPNISYKISAMPMDISRSFRENISPTICEDCNDSDEVYGIISTNTMRLGPNLSYTPFGYGKYITNHVMATQIICDFYKNKHPDMDVFSVLVNSEKAMKKDFGESGLSKAREFLPSLSTGGTDYYWELKDADVLLDYIEGLKNIIESNSITYGEVEDPMGDEVELISEYGLKPASTEELLDGDYYLSDNKGNHMGRDRVVYDKRGSAVKTENLLENLTVYTNPDSTIRINGLNLGEGEEVSLIYKVRLKNEQKNYREDYYYQANKKTTLTPNFNEENIVREFPIPSIKGEKDLQPSKLLDTGVIDFGIKTLCLLFFTMIICYFIYTINLRGEY